MFGGSGEPCLAPRRSRPRAEGTAGAGATGAAHRRRSSRPPAAPWSSTITPVTIEQGRRHRHTAVQQDHPGHSGARCQGLEAASSPPTPSVFPRSRKRGPRRSRRPIRGSQGSHHHPPPSRHHQGQSPGRGERMEQRPNVARRALRQHQSTERAGHRCGVVIPPPPIFVLDQISATFNVSRRGG